MFLNGLAQCATRRAIVPLCLSTLDTSARCGHKENCCQNKSQLVPRHLTFELFLPAKQAYARLLLQVKLT